MSPLAILLAGLRQTGDFENEVTIASPARLEAPASMAPATYAVHDHAGIKRLLQERHADTWFQPKPLREPCTACDDRGWQPVVWLSSQARPPEIWKTCTTCGNPGQKTSPDGDRA